MAVGHFQEAGRRVSRGLELAPDDVRVLKQMAAHRVYIGLT